MKANRPPHYVVSAPPGVSSSGPESSTISQERRRVALAARETTSALMGEFSDKFNALESKVDALLASQAVASRVPHELEDTSQTIVDGVCAKIDRLEALFMVSPMMGPSVDEVLNMLWKQKGNNQYTKHCNLGNVQHFRIGDLEDDIFLGKYEHDEKEHDGKLANHEIEHDRQIKQNGKEHEGTNKKDGKFKHEGDEHDGKYVHNGNEHDRKKKQYWNEYEYEDKNKHDGKYVHEGKNTTEYKDACVDTVGMWEPISSATQTQVLQGCRNSER